MALTVNNTQFNFRLSDGTVIPAGINPSQAATVDVAPALTGQIAAPIPQSIINREKALQTSGVKAKKFDPATSIQPLGRGGTPATTPRPTPIAQPTQPTSILDFNKAIVAGDVEKARSFSTQGLSAKDQQAVIKAGLAGGLSQQQATNISLGQQGGLSAKDQQAVIDAGLAGGLSREEATRISLGQKAPAVSGISTIVDTPTDTTLDTPDLPTGDVSGIQENFSVTAQSNLDNSRVALENAFKTQIEDLQKRTDESNKNIEELNTLQAEGIEDVGELLKPFRETLENAERERLQITKNFEANQLLIDELGTLLTEGNELIRQQKEITGLASIRNPRIDKTISDVNARVGIIQAVLNARNGQINQAYTMIDRTINAIDADRQDQLTYYNSLLNFYESQKDTEGKKLVILDRTKRDFLNAQIGLLENDLAQSQANADSIKSLMLDPETASLMAKAGVTLNDTIEQVNVKMARQIEFEEKSEGDFQFIKGTKTQPAGTFDKDTGEFTQIGEDVPTPAEDVFVTSEGEDIDVKTIIGITSLRDKGYSRAEINSFMDTETKLDKSSRDGLLNEVFGEKKSTLNDSQIPLIIERINQLIKKGDVTRKQIRLMLDTNSFTSKGKLISLTDEQSQKIRDGIRTFFEKIIPGGN